MEPLTILGAAVAGGIALLVGLARREKPEPPAARASREIRQVGVRAYTQVNDTSKRYLASVRENARRK